MTIGQIRALPTPVPSPAPPGNPGGATSDSHPSVQSSNSSLGSGSAPTTATVTPGGYPRRLPLLPSRSQSQLSLPLENHSQALSRAPSPSPRNASGNSSPNTAGPLPTTGSFPLPPTAPNPTHPLPPLPPRPALTATTSSATLATTFSTASTTTLSPVLTTPSSAAPATTSSSVSLSAATSGHGVPGPSNSVSDLMSSNTGANTSSTQKEAGGARTIPQVMVHAAAAEFSAQDRPTPGLSSQGSLSGSGSGRLDVLVGTRTGSQSQISPVSSSSPSDSAMQTAPASPYLAGPPSPAAPLSPQSSGGVSPQSASGLGPQPSPSGSSPKPGPGGLSPHSTGGCLGSHLTGGPHPMTGLPSPSSPGGFAARFGKKKRQLSKDLLKRGGMSCEDLSIHVGGGDGGEGEIVRMIPQHHMQTMGLQHQRSPQSKQPKQYPELAQDRNWEKRPNPPSPPPKPAKLKAQGLLGGALGIGIGVAGVPGRGSVMANSPSIAAAIEYMRHEQDRDPRGGFPARRAIGTTEARSADEHGRHSESASDVSGPSSSVASLLSAETGTGTSASEVVDAKILGQAETYDADISNANTPQAPIQMLDAPSPDATPALFSNPNPFSNPQARPQSPAMHDPDKRVSTASSQRTLMAWNTSKRESGIFVFPSGEHGTSLARVHTTDGVSPSATDPVPLPNPNDQATSSEKPTPRPVRLGQLSGSLKRRSASMSILLPGSGGDVSDSSAREVPPPLPPRRILPTDGVVTDSEGYMSSASNAGGYLSSASNSGLGEAGGRKRMQGGIKGKIAAWTAAADSNGRRKHHPRTAGSSSGHTNIDLEPRRSDSPHQLQLQGQGYSYSHSPASAPALQVHTHLHLPSHSHNQTSLMSIAALAPAARDLALGVGKRVEKFYRARSASGAGHGESHPMMRGASQGSGGMRVASPGSGIGVGLEPTLPTPLRPAIPGASGLIFGRPLDDPGVVKDTEGWVDDAMGGVRRCVGLPVIVSRCVRYLERWGGDEEGLFRISGRPSHVGRLRAEFDAGADYELSEAHPSDLDPHAVSSLFKAYLRELPDPILTRALKYQFDLAMTSTSDTSSSFDLTKLPTSITSFGEASEHMRPIDDSLLADIKVLIDQLPQVNYVLLHELCHLLRYTADHAQTTKMPLGNLLLLFCPTLGLSAGFLRCLVEGQERLFEWGRVAPAMPPSQVHGTLGQLGGVAPGQPAATTSQPAPTPSQPGPPALPPRKPPTGTTCAAGTPKHAPSASFAPASVRSLKSPLNVATDLGQASPRTRSQTTAGTGSAPPSRASMFFPSLGPRRPSITMLFGGGNSNRNSRDNTPRQSTSTSSEEESWEGEDNTEGLYINSKRVTRPPRVSLDIPDGSFAPSLSPPKARVPIQGMDQGEREPSPAKESPSKRGGQTPIADLFKSPLTAAVPTIAPSAVTATGSATLPPRLGLPFRDSNGGGEPDEMGWGRGVLDAASASLGRR
ncbi:hypothetical protein FRC06_001698 [Ceratobasidium sp. 370]|nr:hypothetical protein FRC06_001698 [Ceratobasidium sp. 370]